MTRLQPRDLTLNVDTLYQGIADKCLTFYPPPLPTQQTTTHDFTCSVSEFTSSTGSIHVFSYVSFSRDDTYQ